MKKILLIIAVLFSVAAFSQSPHQLKYNGGGILTGAIDSLGSNDTSYYIIFKNPVNAYTIQFSVVDTIETDSARAKLYGSNWLGGWTAIGDSLHLPNDQATFTTPPKWTGTTFPYAYGKIDILSDTVTEGSLLIHVYYY